MKNLNEELVEKVIIFGLDLLAKSTRTTIDDKFVQLVKDSFKDSCIGGE